LEARDLLTPADQRAEFLLMGLRLSEGVDLGRYEALGGTLAAGGLRMLKQQQLVEQIEGRLRVTESGRLVLNAVIAELVPGTAQCSA
jgi:oxygen-independent coproporphyrinogen-3 oxidase